LWILDTDDWMHLLGGKPTGLRAEIQQHVHRNPEDWPAETLFDQLGAYDASDRRFALFLEGLASADVRPDEAAQRHFVGCVNESLRSCGVELRETGSEGGYPVFSMVSLHAAAKGRPKNLIFASPDKPDLRFRDALDNDVEIVTNADKVLVYDRPIANDGLRWNDLQQWWSDTEQIADATRAKRSLYTRLKASKGCFCSKTVRDFIDMDDFFSVMDAVMAEGAPSGVFNVSTGTGHTIKEIFDIVVDHLGVTLNEPVPEVEPGADDVPAVVLDPSNTIETFGWKPRYSFEQTIRRMLAWYDIHGVTAIYSHLKAPPAKA